MVTDENFVLCRVQTYGEAHERYERQVKNIMDRKRYFLKCFSKEMKIVFSEKVLIRLLENFSYHIKLLYDLGFIEHKNLWKFFIKDMDRTGRVCGEQRDNISWDKQNV